MTPSGCYLVCPPWELLTFLRGELHFGLQEYSIVAVLGWGVRGGLQATSGGGRDSHPAWVLPYHSSCSAEAWPVLQVAGGVPVD